MTSTKELRETLPERAPNEERHLKDHMHQKFAIYTLANLNAAQLQELRDKVNTIDGKLIEDPDVSYARVADQPDFSGRTLRDVYDHHILARDQCDWMDPLFFIVADQEDHKTKGLLVVNLCTFGDDDDEADDTGIIGVARCKPHEAGGWGICFRLAEMDWSELKDAEHEEWGGSDSDEEDEDDSDGE